MRDHSKAKVSLILAFLSFSYVVCLRARIVNHLNEEYQARAEYLILQFSGEKGKKKKRENRVPALLALLMENRA